MFKRSQSLLVVPVLAFASPVLAASDGGTTPLEPRSSIRLVLSDDSAAWGQTVQASGTGLRRSRGRVAVWLEGANGTRRLLGTTVPSKSGRWIVKFKATARGVVTGSQGALFAGPSSVGGKTLRVSAALSLSPSMPLSKKGLVTVTSQVSPKGRWRWSVLRRTSRGSVQLAHGTTLSDGLIRSSLKARRGDRLQVVVAPGGGLDGGSKSTVVARLRPAVASWFGLYGEGVACGGTLAYNQIGVAHKTLPCGTKVTISYRGRTIVAPVIDRGPFIAGREFDLTGAAARALHFDGVGTIWVSP